MKTMNQSSYIATLSNLDRGGYIPFDAHLLMLIMNTLLYFYIMLALVTPIYPFTILVIIILHGTYNIMCASLVSHIHAVPGLRKLRKGNITVV